MLVFSIIVFSAMAITFWYLRHPPEQTKRSGHARTRLPPSDPHPYHAVSVAHRGPACTVVNTVGNRRFLAARVPQLPLPNCDAPHCNCRYVHYDDRRQQDNRRMLYSLRSDLYVLAGNSERRATQGRRKSDREANLASTFDLETMGADMPARIDR